MTRIELEITGSILIGKFNLCKPRTLNGIYLEVLVSRVFANPVRVEDAKGAAVTTDTLFGNGLESSRKLDEDTLVHRFAHCRSLWHGLLAATTSHSDSESRLTST